MNKPMEILKFAMSMEKQGQNFYESFQHQIENPVAKEIFKSLAKTEEDHFKILEKELKKIDETGNWSMAEELKDLVEKSIYEIRQEAEKLYPEQTNMSTSDISILRMAYLIENDFAEYYKKALENTEDENGKKILQTLYNWEHEHREVFYEEYRKAMEGYWFQQGFYPF